MLNEQKSHRSNYNSLFAGQGISPLSSQGFNAMDRQRHLSSHKGSSSRRQSTHKIKRNSIAVDDDDNASRNDDVMDEEYDSQSAADYDEMDEIEMEEDDTDNQLWCFCQRKSYGQMVACDNQQCQFTWFHYDCVGLKEAPEEGKIWYCPVCRNRLASAAHSSKY